MQGADVTGDDAVLSALINEFTEWDHLHRLDIGLLTRTRLDPSVIDELKVATSLADYTKEQVLDRARMFHDLFVPEIQVSLLSSLDRAILTESLPGLIRSPMTMRFATMPR